MRFDSSDACSEGVRRIARIAPPGANRDKIARLARIPRPDGSPLWKFPDTFSLYSPDGFGDFLLPNI